MTDANFRLTREEGSTVLERAAAICRDEGISAAANQSVDIKDLIHAVRIALVETIFADDPRLVLHGS